MDELRRIKRTQVFKPARILTAHSDETIDCIVSNLTNAGASLRISAAKIIPDRFELIFDSMHFRRGCEVRWRNGECLGVSFALRIE